MHLDRILEHNRGFTKGRAPAPLAPLEKLDLAVVACFDPRLDALLPGALGISPGGAFLIRSAGALVQPGGSSMRSLALSVFLFGVTEVVVVGHTSCRMAAFDSAKFIDSFRRRGVAREAFGLEDLRAWAGAIPSPKRGVETSVANVLAAPFLPRDLSVAGLLLDDATGAVEVVVRPGEAPAAAAASTPAGPPAAPPAIQSAPPPAAPAEQMRRRGPEKRGAPDEVEPLVDALEEFVALLASKAELRDELRRVRAELDRQSSPLVKFGLLEDLARRAAEEHKDIAEAFKHVRLELAATRREWDPQEVVNYFLKLIRRS